jgi:cyclopropane fatty-acyl-phospholipid synthase-like methyltransferase
MTKDFNLEKEINIHGKRWQTLHDGYFSDGKIARPFLDAVSDELLRSKPNVVTDLGGGTGFILSELAKRHPASSAKYINVDISSEQLNECRDDRICSLQFSATDITRNLLIKDEESLMLIMRSLMHYLGSDRIELFLRHLRGQMKPGEPMVHQTACYKYAEDADCANKLYSMMHTDKWYTTIDGLKRALSEAGWQVIDCKPAPSLRMTSRDLAERYDLNSADIANINKALGNKSNRPDVFVCENPEFTAYLHYQIFTCRAMEQ